MKQLAVFTDIELTDIIARVLNSEIPKILKKENISSPEEKKEFLTREEACKMLNISYSGMHYWIKQGLLTPKKIGNRSFFFYQDIIQLLNK